jgi:hypothetical protein
MSLVVFPFAFVFGPICKHLYVITIFLPKIPFL